MLNVNEQQPEAQVTHDWCLQARDAAQKAYDAATAMHCKLHKDQRSLQADLDAIK